MDRHESHFQNNSSTKQTEEQYIDSLLAVLQDSAIPPLYDTTTTIASSSQPNIVLVQTPEPNTPQFSYEMTRRIQIIEESLEDLVLEGRQKFGLVSTPTTSSMSPRWQPVAPLSIAPTTPLIVSSAGSTPLQQHSIVKENVPHLSLDNSPPSTTSSLSTSQNSFQQAPPCQQQLIETVANKYQQFIQKYEPVQPTPVKEAEATNYVQAMYQWAYSGNTTKNLRETIRNASALAPPSVYNTAPPRTRSKKDKKEQPTDDSENAKKKRAARRNSTGNIMDTLNAPCSSSSSATTPMTSLATTSPQTPPFIAVLPPQGSSSTVPSSSSQVPQPFAQLGLELLSQGGANAAKALAVLQKMKKQYSFTEVTSQSLKHKADKDRKRKEAKRRRHNSEADSPLSEESTESFSNASSSMMNQNSSMMSTSAEEFYPSPQQPMITQPYFNTTTVVPAEADNTSFAAASSSTNMMVPQYQQQQQQQQQQQSAESLFGNFFYGNQPKSKKSKHYEAFMSNWKI